MMSPFPVPGLELQRPLLSRDQEGVRELNVLQFPHLWETREGMWS